MMRCGLCKRGKRIRGGADRRDLDDEKRRTEGLLRSEKRRIADADGFDDDGFKGLSADEYRKHIAAVNAAGHWPTYVISNHYIVRSYTRYGDGEHNDDIAKMMAALYLTLRGTPINYYGEELGWRTTTQNGKRTCRTRKASWDGRRKSGGDGERTPMQWNDSAMWGLYGEAVAAGAG